MNNKENIEQWLKENLSEEKYLHSLGACKKSAKLADMFDVDVKKASMAGLLHDCAKCINDEKLYEIIKKNKLNVSKMELKSPKTLHAPVGAFIAQSQFGIEDKEVLQAIRFHTIGRVGMGMIEKIVFLADKIETKTRAPKWTQRVMGLIEQKSLDHALLECYQATLKKLSDRKLVINPQTIEVWNDLLIKTQS